MLNKILKVLYTLLYILFIISFVFMGIEVYNLGLLPNKYLIPIIIGISVLIIIVTLGFKYIKKVPLKILLSIIQLLLIIGSIFSILYLNNTNNFLKNIKAPENETNIYYLIVDKNSHYKKVQDLENKNIGIFMNNDKANNKLKEKITFKQIQLKTFTDVIENIKKIDGVYLNSAYYDLICDEVEDFDKKVRIIEKIKITSDVDLINNKVNTTKEAFNILISGIDTKGPIGTVSRSDVNIIMTVNPNTHEILLTHIPRDFYVKLHGTNGPKDKLTHAGIYGIDMSLKTIEDLLDIKINYYVRVNFTTLIKIVDTIGGIDVVSDKAFSEYGYSYKKGVNHLNGMQSLMYSRIRHVLEGGDRARGKHQEQVITAIFEKITNSEVLLKDYNKILSRLADSLQTNITPSTIKEFIKKQLDTMTKWDINSISVDGSSSKGNCYSMPGKDLYIMIPNQNTVDNAHKYISGIIGGQKYSEI